MSRYTIGENSNSKHNITKSMVGPFPLAPHHDYLQYMYHVYLMHRGQNQGVTINPTNGYDTQCSVRRQHDSTAAKYNIFSCLDFWFFDFLVWTFSNILKILKKNKSSLYL